MRVSDYIIKLEELKKQNGDVEVETYNSFSGRRTANAPKVSFTKVLRGRESKPAFYDTYMDQDRKGDLVIEI